MLRELCQAAAIALGIARNLLELHSIVELSDSVTRAQFESESKVFAVALGEARRVTGAFSASARVADLSRQFLEPVHHDGEPGRLVGKPIHVGSGANGAAYTLNRPVVIPNVADRDTWPDLGRIEYLMAREETQCECAIPVTWTGEKIGVLNFEHRQPFALVPFTGYLRMVAGIIGHALYQRRRERRVLRSKSNQLVRLLAAFYLTVNHSIASSFRGIREELEKLEPGGLSPDMESIVSQALRLAQDGTRDAEALLVGAATGLEDDAAIDPAKLVRQAGADILAARGLAPDAVAISCDTDEVALVLSRPQMLQWVLREVIDNSFRYGAKQVVARIARSRGDAVSVSIDDDGPGLSELEIAELYELTRESLRPHGSGLALCAAREYIRVMGGEISSVRSNLGGLRTVLILPEFR
jgi:hypothetical protein